MSLSPVVDAIRESASCHLRTVEVSLYLIYVVSFVIRTRPKAHAVPSKYPIYMKAYVHEKDTYSVAKVASVAQVCETDTT